jgi:hypothetical protein
MIRDSARRRYNKVGNGSMGEEPGRGDHLRCRASEARGGEIPSIHKTIYEANGRRRASGQFSNDLAFRIAAVGLEVRLAYPGPNE